MAAERPTVAVQFSSEDASKLEQVAMPDVLRAPIRIDIVRMIHRCLRLSLRQPTAVHHSAGMDVSAESWGTGRAVSRAPRVHGGGTHRAGQVAFAPFARGGRMFKPKRLWKRWRRMTPKNQKRYAVCSALSATAVPALVMARGHQIQETAEVPLVVAAGKILDIEKTKDALDFLDDVGAGPEVDRCANRKKRAGKSKWRNRKTVTKRGPLIVVKDDAGSALAAFRNIPGVEVVRLDYLNLLDLAPGGSVGRFVIWADDAFKALDATFGTYDKDSTVKSGFRPPRSCFTNCDITRIMSDPAVHEYLRYNVNGKYPWAKGKKGNPFKNRQIMYKLNPYERFLDTRREEEAEARKGAREDKKAALRDAAKDKAEDDAWRKKLNMPNLQPQNPTYVLPSKPSLGTIFAENQKKAAQQ
eukprot:CAMPEP_0168518768 /NCGR_PEP_ID=MMETSP0405-20121227/6909_1 /TAXON_ID=498012 /ORGANISM="Trichosphaerium sp, Strain Am-I-7 wt" /LENGTH=412 /DNA_ID=CAMNT_0008539163 /DNA_START=34 /DNA_END=1272 /DNA_ORIENTATION=+